VGEPKKREESPRVKPFGWGGGSERGGGKDIPMWANRQPRATPNTRGGEKKKKKKPTHESSGAPNGWEKKKRFLRAQYGIKKGGRGCGKGHCKAKAKGKQEKKKKKKCSSLAWTLLKRGKGI